MESSTLDVVQRTISELPEPYIDLAACCMTVVHDLSIGHSDRYQEKVSQLAESYFVLMIEALREARHGMLATPSVIRGFLQKAVADDKSLSVNPHAAQLVDAVFEQFEVRLSSLIVDASSGAVTLPGKGPCDLLVPVFASLVRDRVHLVDYDTVEALKSSTRDAFSEVPLSDIEDCFVRFCASIVGIIRERGTHSSRITGALLSFICEYQQLYPETMASRLEPLRLELSQKAAKTPVHSHSFTIN
jgi:hypothetical protein